MMGADAEIEALRAAGSRHFTVSQITVNPFAGAFHVIVGPNRLDAGFAARRRGRAAGGRPAAPPRVADPGDPVRSRVPRDCGPEPPRPELRRAPEGPRP